MGSTMTATIEQMYDESFTKSMTDAAEDLAGLTYEQALAQLDSLIARLEKGDIPLDEAISAYERGSRLASHCAELLDRTEQRVSQLMVGGDGSLKERPLEAPPAAPAEPPRAVRARIDPGEIPF
jgi:exodeoxyribonuclease VII small subunit